MSQSEFKQEILKHLVSYKTKQLKNTNKGEYNYNKYDHIFSKDERYLNFLEPYNYPNIISELSETGIKLHKGFGHLNSSQVMTINYFMPYLKQKSKLKHLSNIFSAHYNKAYRFKNITLEHLSDIEQDGFTRTTVDVLLEAEDHHVFIEVKYTENGFESKSNDSYITRYNQVYLPIMKKLLHDKIIKSIVPYDVFMKDYQMYRMMCHVSIKDRVIFLYPKDNKPIDKSIRGLRTYISDDYVSVLYLEDLCVKTNDYISQHQTKLSYYYKV